MPNALLSLRTHEGLERVAEKLIARNFRLYATKETLAYLRAHDIDATSLPLQIRAGDYQSAEVLRTEVFDSLLADEEWTQWPKFDVVCTEVSDPSDMVNRVLLAVALEGKRVPLISLAECDTFIDVWDSASDEVFESEYQSLVFRADLALAKSTLGAAALRSGVELFHLIGKKWSQPAYGENPHQESHGFYALVGNGKADDPLAIPRFMLVRGSPLSHNNYLDLSRAVDTISRIAAVYAYNNLPVLRIAVGVKHGTVCGAAHFTNDPYVTLKAMIEGQPRDIFGGVVIVNFEIDAECARLLLTHATESGRVLDVVIAPSITSEARQILSRKNEKCRMLVNTALLSMNAESMEKGSVCTMVRGSVLVQEAPLFRPRLSDTQLQFDGAWTAPQHADMLLAWAVGSASLSNSITLVKDGMLVGNGVAATSRVEACLIAVSRAADRSKGSVAYSDSFFPFIDGVDALADHGVSCIFASDGSRMDAQVKKRMHELGMNSCFVADTVGRGFRH